MITVVCTGSIASEAQGVKRQGGECGEQVSIFGDPDLGSLDLRSRSWDACGIERLAARSIPGVCSRSRVSIDYQRHDESSHPPPLQTPWPMVGIGKPQAGCDRTWVR